MTLYLELVKEFATIAHLGQLDKGGQPYILHPIRVGDALAPYGPVAQAAGYLHDVVEDTDCSLKVIRETFGEAVASTVLSVTRLDPVYQDRLGFKVERKETYKEFLERSAAHPIGKFVKIEDVRDNSSPERMSQLPESERGMIKRYQRALAFLLEGKPW